MKGQAKDFALLQVNLTFKICIFWLVVLSDFGDVYSNCFLFAETF